MIYSNRMGDINLGNVLNNAHQEIPHITEGFSRTGLLELINLQPEYTKIGESLNVMLTQMEMAGKSPELIDAVVSIYQYALGAYQQMGMPELAQFLVAPAISIHRDSLSGSDYTIAHDWEMEIEAEVMDCVKELAEFMLQAGPGNGRLVVDAKSMFTEKTFMLIEVFRHMITKNKSVLGDRKIVAAIAGVMGEEHIVTRMGTYESNGSSHQSVSSNIRIDNPEQINSMADFHRILDSLKPGDVLMIDEFSFIPSPAEVPGFVAAILKAVKEGIGIYLAGLEEDYRGITIDVVAEIKWFLEMHALADGTYRISKNTGRAAYKEKDGSIHTLKTKMINTRWFTDAANGIGLMDLFTPIVLPRGTAGVQYGLIPVEIHPLWMALHSENPELQRAAKLIIDSLETRVEGRPLSETAPYLDRLIDSGQLQLQEI